MKWRRWVAKTWIIASELSVFHVTDMQDACFLFVAAPEEAPLPTDLQNIHIIVLDMEI